MKKPPSERDRAPAPGHPQGVSLPRVDRRAGRWGAEPVDMVGKRVPMWLGRIHDRPIRSGRGATPPQDTRKGCPYHGWDIGDMGHSICW
jgi:hypothetical protein